MTTATPVNDRLCYLQEKFKSLAAEYCSDIQLFLFRADSAQLEAVTFSVFSEECIVSIESPPEENPGALWLSGEGGEGSRFNAWSESDDDEDVGMGGLYLGSWGGEIVILKGYRSKFDVQMDRPTRWEKQVEAAMASVHAAKMSAHFPRILGICFSETFVSIVQAKVPGDSVWTMMPELLADKESLKRVLMMEAAGRLRSPLSLLLGSRLCVEICHFVQELHDQRMALMDFKPEHLMVEKETGNFKIIDNDTLITVHDNQTIWDLPAIGTWDFACLEFRQRLVLGQVGVRFKPEGWTEGVQGTQVCRVDVFPLVLTCAILLGGDLEDDEEGLENALNAVSTLTEFSTLPDLFLSMPVSLNLPLHFPAFFNELPGGREGETLRDFVDKVYRSRLDEMPTAQQVGDVFHRVSLEIARRHEEVWRARRGTSVRRVTPVIPKKHEQESGISVLDAEGEKSGPIASTGGEGERDGGDRGGLLASGGGEGEKGRSDRGDLLTSGGGEAEKVLESDAGASGCLIASSGGEGEKDGGNADSVFRQKEGDKKGTSFNDNTESTEAGSSRRSSTKPGDGPHTQRETWDPLKIFEPSFWQEDIPQVGRLLVPAKVEGAFQLDETSLLLRLRTAAGGFCLQISWHPKLARVAIAKPPPRGKERLPYSLSEVTSTVLKNKILVDVSFPRLYDRVLSFGFASSLQGPIESRLYVEVQGSRSNVILVSEDGRGDGEGTGTQKDAETADKSSDTLGVILGCGYQVGPSQSVRPLQTGRPYRLPPLPLTESSVPLPHEISKEEFVAVVKQKASAASRDAKNKAKGRFQILEIVLVRSFAGVGPTLAKRMVESLKTSSDSESADAMLCRLFEGAWTEWLSVLASVSAGSVGEKEEREGASATATCFDFARQASLLSAAAASAGGGAECLEERQRSPCVDLERRTLLPFLFRNELEQIEAAKINKKSEIFEAKTSEDADREVDSEEESFVVFRSLGAALESYYRLDPEGALFEDLRGECERACKQSLQKALKREAETTAQLEKAKPEILARTRRRADLLLAFQYSWEEGDPVVRCEMPEGVEEVAVEPGKTPVQTAETLYKRVTRLERSFELVAAVAEEAKMEREWAESVKHSLESVVAEWRQAQRSRGGEEESDTDSARKKSAELLTAFREIAEELGLRVRSSDPSGSGGEGKGKGAKGKDKQGKKGKQGGKQKQKQKGKDSKRAPGGKERKGEVPEGLLVVPLLSFSENAQDPSPFCVVGKNNKQNDRVTHKFARPNDIWLHVKGLPGSHCVLRGIGETDTESEEEGEMPRDSGADRSTSEENGGSIDPLQAAADIAALFSKAKQEKKVAVTYTKASNVKRPRKAKPGAVLIQEGRESIIWASPERGKRLLDSIEAGTA
uniref:Protein kinase domain-containing protein n=1 Tax=Chromera velia CCMP2878 TaxID=1169474 RepID=A0A0G4H1D3_9ALVE|eukprot:Cvel_797.t1-p1 / transcript=Cvel_797.t1 / gene=Cvel_797 / organism=Chromera_velia_CCMP2878 / gene_product=Uncharacterized protein YloA, putative / transcript_product=Uncharacterized protein YloA, putative / location=Cvel_scaffold25:11685-23330(+) / protein_length=1381 / sequence_SO=supercontig / SO=protein_coding / is_pseudo=false